VAFRRDQVVIRTDEGVEVLVDVPWVSTRIEVGMPVRVVTVDGTSVVQWESSPRPERAASGGRTRRLISHAASLIHH